MTEKFSLGNEEPRFSWEEGTDWEQAYWQLVSEGYDPEERYCVARKEKDLITVVAYGNLMFCLEEASKNSSQGYYVVLPVSSLEHTEKVEVH